MAYDRKISKRELAKLSFDEIVMALNDKRQKNQQQNEVNQPTSDPLNNPGLVDRRQPNVHVDQAISVTLPMAVSDIGRIFADSRRNSSSFVHLKNIPGGSTLLKRRFFEDVWRALVIRELAFENPYGDEDSKYNVTAAGLALLRLGVNQEIRTALTTAMVDTDTPSDQLMVLLIQICQRHAIATLKAAIDDQTAVNPAMQILARQLFKFV